jgi:thioredoxin-dependent peroxiredoxin
MAKKTAKRGGKKASKTTKKPAKKSAAKVKKTVKKPVKKVTTKAVKRGAVKATKKAAKKVARRPVAAKRAAKPAPARKAAAKPVAKPKVAKVAPPKPVAPKPVPPKPVAPQLAPVEQPVVSQIVVPPAPVAPPPAAVRPAATPPREADESLGAGGRGPRFYEPDELPTADRAGAEEPFYHDDRRDRPIYDTESGEIDFDEDPAEETAEVVGREVDDFDDEEEDAGDDDDEDEGRPPNPHPPPSATAGVTGAMAASAEAPPQIGAKAPDFALPDEQGRPHSLAEYRGRKVVLYFYPKDDTPGCTREACGFRDVLGELDTRNAIVLGVSPDSSASHGNFAKKYGLTFALLADEGHKLAERYGAWGEKAAPGGVKKAGVLRTTFVIDEVGRIAQVFRQVKPDGHEREVLNWLDRNWLSSG